jgi:hypothetical protein
MANVDFGRARSTYVQEGENVNCIAGPCGADRDEGLLPERDLRQTLAREGRTRQAAALYLHAARMTDSTVVRELLRRRAARLILPDWPDPGQSLDS